MISQHSLLKCSWPVIIQCAKASRKPIWLPVAKSKIYRVPPRPNYPKDEADELQRLNNMYKTQMKALKEFFKQEKRKDLSSLSSASSEISLRAEAEDWEKCVKINEEWNKKIAIERDERRKLALAAMEEYALKRMDEIDKKRNEMIAKASEEIREQKELAGTFITADNLEEAVDRALNNIVDYNFTINLKGDIHHGRDTPHVNETKNAAKENDDGATLTIQAKNSTKLTSPLELN